MASNNNNSSTNNPNNNNNNDKENDLRKKILAINADTSLSAIEKSKKIQMLMTPHAFVEQPPPSISYQEAMEPTYAKKDEEETIFGCKHYMRDCKLKAACCGKLFTCRFCHDENSDHQINRYETKEIMCMHCKTIQPVSNTCTNCNKTFARYFCDYCKFFDNKPGKDIFHCPHCKMCRIGKGLGIDFQHCDKCNACLAIREFSNHKCIENKFESSCPICKQYMFTSTQSITVMECGHGIHAKCFYKYSETNFKCPLCAKSILKPAEMSGWWRAYDNSIRIQPMPKVFRNRVAHIQCNDCGEKAWTPFHFLGHKCAKCGGYATTILTQKTIDSKDPVELAKNHLVRYDDDPDVIREQAEARAAREGENSDEENEEELEEELEEGEEEGDISSEEANDDEEDKGDEDANGVEESNNNGTHEGQ